VNPALPDLSVRLLLAVRTGDAAAAERLVAQIAGLDPTALAVTLSSDAERIAAWLNLYNAATQRLVDADPMSYAHRFRFFRGAAITVAGQRLSLDSIEHGLLRRSRLKVGLGWLTNPLVGRFERRFRVGAVDPRIHFALNCAAASCPPIAAYDPAHVDAQLDLATRSHLASTVQRQGDRLVVPRVFLWFMGDFGGPRGVRRFLGRHGVDAGVTRIRYARWDWSARPAAWGAEWPPGDAGGAGHAAVDSDGSQE
jgi:hypothetical protein